MEIKHTIEILTKDIQDIEKLVGNLQNSQDGTAIELDLALSKLRNVYEILTMIKADRLQGLFQPEKVREPAAGTEPEAVAAPEPEPEAVAAPEPEPEAVAAPEPEPEAVAAPEPEPEAVAAPEPEPEAVAAPEPEPEAMAAPGPGPEAVAAPGPEAEPVTQPKPKKPKEAAILAEKFSSESRINENLGGQRVKEKDAKLVGRPIDQISRNIGINDRFLIIRELFEGNSDEFGKLIEGLDGADGYGSAMEILNSRFADSPEHEGVEILASLIKRRFLHA